jgi:ABC-type nitrate/sulfonate/bicarbonate transport system permease component
MTSTPESAAAGRPSRVVALLVRVAQGLTGFAVVAGLWEVARLTGILKSAAAPSAAEFVSALGTSLRAGALGATAATLEAWAITVLLSAAIGCAWPVVVNADDGARRVDQRLLDTARAAQLSRPAILLRVVLPASLPQAVAGLRFGVSIALVMMVISELIGASSGLGYFIANAESNFAYADLWAAVVVLGIIGWLATSLFSPAERRILFWHREQRG